VYSGRKGSASLNKVSVVIPIGKGEQPYLTKLLYSIEHQTIPCEVLLMDKGSVGAARRDGVLEASGYIMAFIDSDCVLPFDTWMEEMLDPFEDPEVVCTHTLGKFHKDDPAIMRYSMLSQPYFDGLIPGTGHTLIRKDAILEVGNFQDVRSCEDRLLIDKLNGKMIYMPNHRVYHYHATTIRQFLYKQWRCKCGCDDMGKRFNRPDLLYQDDKARKYRNTQIKYNTRHFLWALIGKEDSAWLLWPFIGFCQLMIYRVVSKVYKHG
jgi:glycosyltransferase involved in cell wall biosynthesis